MMKEKNKIPVKVDFLQSMEESRNFDRDFILQDRLWQKAKADYDAHFLGGEATDEFRIPKIIHHIWLGGPLPQKYVEWMESWKRFHPDWEYHLWTDDNIGDVPMANREAFEKSTNFGTKSDILRYELLHLYGGLYTDTDFECFFPFDYLHQQADFFTGIVFGRELSMANGIIGSAPGHPILKTMLEKVAKPVISDDASVIHEQTGPWAFTAACVQHLFDEGFHNLMMPVTYLYPFPNDMLHVQNRKQVLKYMKKESMALHYWEVAWLNDGTILGKIKHSLLRHIPVKTKERIKKVLGKG